VVHDIIIYGEHGGRNGRVLKVHDGRFATITDYWVSRYYHDMRFNAQMVPLSSQLWLLDFRI
jgi:hypothetical protein